MISLMVKIFIFISHVYILSNINAENIELGQSSCRYAGNIDPKGIGCKGQDELQLNNLPKNECTSYVYDGVTCLDDYTIVPTYYPHDLENIKSLTNFSNKVFIFYGRLNYIAGLMSDDFNDGIKTESENLKKFIVEYPVAGLIITGIYNPITMPNNEYYEKLESYITALRNNNLNLKIGLYVYASAIIFFRNDTTWFDFSKINSIMDYYLITFRNFNDCMEQLLKGGTTPLDSQDPGVHSLNQFADALNASNITKEKVYLEFLLTPTVSFDKLSTTLHCDISYSEYCLNNNSSMCADNQKTFYEKGVFAKTYAKGWVGSDVDLVDPQMSCNCDGDQLISFHMILDAYNGKDMRTCDKLKD